MTDRSDWVLPLIVEETQGRSRADEPVTVGVPLPKGVLFDSRNLTLCAPDGKTLPVQSQALSRWSDSSIKWILLDFQVTVGASSQGGYELRAHTRPKEFETPKLLVVHTTSELIVDTGAAKFFMDQRFCKPLDRVLAKGSDLLSRTGSSLMLIDPSGREFFPHVDEIALEAAGPLRATVRTQGQFRDEKGDSLARFLVCLNFYAGTGLVEMKTTLHNPKAACHRGGLWDLGDEGSIYFKDLSLRIALCEEPTRLINWTTEPFRKSGTDAVDSLEIYQDSSGGGNWRSTNHVNRFGKVMHRFRGYRVISGAALIEEGLRATPIVAIQSYDGGVSATIEKFWENFPKAIEADANTITLRLFPGQYNDVFELQGGEQKTHTMYLQFCPRGEDQADLSWVHHRLVPRATPEWYANSKAIPYLSPRSEDRNIECQQLIDTAIEGPQSFFARREIIDEYGWRNFGDLYADHEAVNHRGEMPLVAHYNNQYDVIYGSLVQYLRCGDKRWFELASDLAKHVVDIDIYHTDEDRPAYNGGLFWHTDHYVNAGTATHRSFSKAALITRKPALYGGGPANEHNYTTGLLHYYYLTGDVAARQAVISLADWVINMDDGSHRFLAWLDKRPTGFCSASARRDYHGPGRGAGNSLNALIDAFSLTNEVKYFSKADEIICRCIHPDDDFEARELGNIEHHWSYLVFLQALSKYLDTKIAKDEIDFMYSYARASLVHYAEWMLSHEVPYATVLHKVEIPTETWPAQDIRKSVIFHLAARYVASSLHDAFENRAEFFFNCCISHLNTFATCTLTRPIALLLSNAHVHSYCELDRHDSAPQPKTGYNFGQPQRFSTQFAELYWVRQKLAEFKQFASKNANLLRLTLRKNCSSEAHNA